MGGSSRALCRVNLSSPQAQVETTTRKEGKSKTGKAIVTDRVGVFVNLGSMAPDEVLPASRMISCS